ncbi:hypothetical protein Moror_8156 [Moniliophthora roreri MCA 2997]|uniref:Uncharacterized protein n=2 Tax=Moniliophthora roreri TaxID=221103 RepID=V2YRT1_MONRO|nr:hypothetical protein Moror_8156 [Moniliophthora roreri MCA 2997]
MSALFILGTASLVFNARNIVSQAIFPLINSSRVSPESVYQDSMTPRYIMMLLANIIADAILIWRCYIVWSGNIKIIMFPAALCLTNNILGTVVIVRYSTDIGIGLLAFIIDVEENTEDIRVIAAFLLMTALTNLLITVMIAGRIYFISHKASKYVDKNVNKMYRTVIAVVLESGLIYPISLIIYTSSVLAVVKTISMMDESEDISEGQNRMQLLTMLMQTTLNQFVGIAPTLIIVRTGLGICVENVEQAVSTMRSAKSLLDSKLKPQCERVFDISHFRRDGSKRPKDVSVHIKVERDVERQ